MTDERAIIGDWIDAEALTAPGLDPIQVHVDPALAAMLTSAHTRVFTVAAIDTKLGPEQLSADIP
ncbi:MAG: hypothetical protein KC457_03980, partial [Myxococcales bacterium]|nr:hypothetical protein [Myxococcales bacterium]